MMELIATALANVNRVGQMKQDQSAGVTIFSSHDAIDLNQMQQLGSPENSEMVVPARKREFESAAD